MLRSYLYTLQTGKHTFCCMHTEKNVLKKLIENISAVNDDAFNVLGRLRSRESRSRAGKALRNIVHALPEDKKARREVRVLKLLEQVCPNIAA